MSGYRSSRPELDSLPDSVEEEVAHLRSQITLLEAEKRDSNNKNKKLAQQVDRLKEKIIVAVRDMQKYKDEATELNEKRLLAKRDAKRRKHGPDADNSEEALENTIKELRSDLDDCRNSWAMAQDISNMRIKGLERLNETLAHSVSAQAVRMSLAETRADLFKKQNTEMLANASKGANPHNRAVVQAKSAANAARKEAAVTEKRLQNMARQNETEIQELRSLIGDEQDAKAELEGKLVQAKEELFEASTIILGYEIEQAVLQKELERCAIATKPVRGRFTSWVSY